MANFSIPLPDRATFDESNPWFDAIQKMQQIKNASQQEAANKLKMQFMLPELQRQQQEEQIKQKYLEPTLQNQLAMQQLRLALQQKLMAQPYAGKASDWQTVETKDGLVRLNKLTGKAIPVLDSSGKPVMPLGKAPLVQFGAGNISIPQGGDLPTYTAAQAQPQVTPAISAQTTSMAEVPGGDIVQPLGSSAHRYSNLGKVFEDVKTGGARLVAPSSTQAMLADRLANAQLVSPEFIDLTKTISKVVPKETGLSAAAQWGWHETQHALGNPSQEYQDYVSAKNHGIPLVIDKLSNAMKLPKTNETIKMLKDAMTPSSTESRYEYDKGLSRAYANLLIESGQIKDMLKGGINLDKVDKKYLRKSLEDKVFSELYDNRVSDHLKQLGFVPEGD